MTRVSLDSARELIHMRVYEVQGSGTRALAYGPGDAGVRWHLEWDEGRLADILRLVPDSVARLRVLELGASPYILTYAFARQGISVVAGGLPLAGAVNPQCIEFETPSSGVVATVPLARFNVEFDSFPFEDESFDLVIAGELIEHLAHRPDHLLMECNRVLTTGGRLILSTPNAVSLTRILLLARGANLDWPFSEQGLYGRHNRLYTAAELRDLLSGNGFGPAMEGGLNFPHPREWYRRGMVGQLKWATMASLHRVIARHPRSAMRLSEGLLIAADKTRSAVEPYRPGWLFGGADTVPMVAGHHSSGSCDPAG
jgi:SAM-dependent methyltransferase